MQLDPRFQERIAVVVTVIVGILSAIYLGKMTAQGQLGSIAMISLGAAGVASLIHFRERVWGLDSDTVATLRCSTSVADSGIYLPLI